MKIYSPKIIGNIRIEKIETLPEYTVEYKNRFLFETSTSQIFYGGVLDWINLSSMIFETGYDQLKLFPTNLIDENINPDIFIDNINIYNSCKYDSDSIALYPVIENDENIMFAILNNIDYDFLQDFKDSSICEHIFQTSLNHLLYYIPYGSLKFKTVDNKTGLDMINAQISQIIPNIDITNYKYLRFEFNIYYRGGSNTILRIDGKNYSTEICPTPLYPLQLVVGAYAVSLIRSTTTMLLTSINLNTWNNIIFIKNQNSFLLYVNNEYVGIYNEMPDFGPFYTVGTEMVPLIITSNSELHIGYDIQNAIFSDTKISKIDQINLIPSDFKDPDEYVKLYIRTINANDLIIDYSSPESNIIFTEFENISETIPPTKLLGNRAIYFSGGPGVMSGFKVLDSEDFNLGLNNGPFTIETFINTKYSYGTIFHKYGTYNNWSLSNGNFIYFGIYPNYLSAPMNQDIVFQYNNGSNSYHQVKYQIALNTTYYISIEYDGVGTRLYIDNVLVDYIIGDYFKPEICDTIYIGKHLQYYNSQYQYAYNYYGYINNFIISKGICRHSDCAYIPSSKIENINTNDLLVLDLNNRQIFSDISINPNHPYLIEDKIYFNDLSYLPILYSDYFSFKTYDFTISTIFKFEEKLGLNGLDNFSKEYSTPIAESNILPEPYIFSARDEDAPIEVLVQVLKCFAFHAFDQNLSTAWIGETSPYNIMIDYGENNKKCINKYCIRNIYMPLLSFNIKEYFENSSWKLQASNNPLATVFDEENINDWITLHTVDNFSDGILSRWTPNFTFINYIKYQKYRLFNISCGGIGEIKLIEDVRSDFYTIPQYIFSCGTPEYNYSIGISEDKKLFFESNISGENQIIYSDENLEYNVEYNLEISRYNGVLTIYLNGNSIISLLFSNNIIFNSNSSIKIGSKYDLTGRFKGYLKNFIIYNNYSKHKSNFTLSNQEISISNILNIDSSWLLATNFYPNNNGTVEDISIYKNLITNNNLSRHSSIICNGDFLESVCTDINIVESTIYLKNSYLSIHDNVKDWEFKTENFTIESWINITNVNLNYEQGIISFGNDLSNFFGLNYKLSTSRFVLRYLNETLDINLQYDIKNIILVSNRWYFISLSRMNGVLYFHLSGVNKPITKVGLSDASVSIINEFNSFLVINHTFQSEFTELGELKFHNLTISKGISKYSSSNYIPPYNIPLDKYIVLQLQYDPAIGFVKDISLPISSYFTPINIGYSGMVFEYPIYINPSKNWEFGNSDFRIDFDIYYLEGSDYSSIIDYGFSNSVNGWGIFIKPITKNIIFSIRSTYNSSETIFSTPVNAINPNCWVHVSFVRFGNIFSIYINGINNTPSSTITRSIGTYDPSRYLCLGKSIYSNDDIKTAKYYIANLIISKNSKYNLSYIKHDIVPTNLSEFPKSFIEICNYKENYYDHVNMVADLNYSISPTISTFGGSYSDLSKWVGAVLSLDGNIYAIPHSSQSILKISSNDISLIQNPISSTYKFSTGVLTPNNDIYLIPYNTTNIISFNPTSQKFSTITTSFSGDRKWYGSIMAPDSNIYCPPLSSTGILKIDLSSKVPTASISSSPVNAGQQYMGAVLALDNCIYSIPYDSVHVLKIFLNSIDINTLYSVFPISISGNAKWSGGVLGPDGNIYCIPYTATSILKIIPGVDPIFSTFGDFTGSSKWSGGVLGPDGNIYCIPYNSTQVLKIYPGVNPMAELLPTILSGPSKWIGGILGFDGSIYGIPYNSTNILKISFPKLKRNFNSNILLSPYLNKF